MPNLGDFTAAMAEAEEEPTTFDLHGESFTVRPQISAHIFLRFSEMAGDIDPSDGEAVAAIEMVMTFEMLKDVIVESDWDRFKDTVKKHRVDMPTMYQIMQAVMAGAAAVPTDAPGGSQQSPGRTSRKSSSKRSASSRGSRRESPAGMRPVKPGDEHLLTQILSGQVVELPTGSEGARPGSS